MFLLEKAIHYDRDQIICSTGTHRDLNNPLRHADCLPAHATIEYAAQAAGVHGGLLQRDQFPHASVQMGYLAVISNMQWQVERLDDLSEELIIHARRTAVTSGGCAYQARIEHKGSVIMSGNLIIATPTEHEVL